MVVWGFEFELFSATTWHISIPKLQENSKICEYLNMNGLQPPRWYICLLKTQQTQKTASLNVSEHEWFAANKNGVSLY